MTQASSHLLGMHYFPDDQHYRQQDLLRWLPEMCALGIHWLTLRTPLTRTIPEYFIRGLQEAKIQPILHFHIPLEPEPNLDDLLLFFENYARWSVRHVVLFDRPNQRTSWSTIAWSQDKLVERFLDCFIPVAEQALVCGLTPIFPPLEPGGDYWDTTFLRSALRGIQRRASKHLLQELIIGAYAWTRNRPLNWGAGGPESWPNARPYLTPPNSQDQCGFRIFDWYISLARAELGSANPVLLLGAGALPNDPLDPNIPTMDAISLHTKRNLEIARLITSQVPGEEIRFDTMLANNYTLPEVILACNFWLLSASENSPYASHAWFQNNGKELPIVAALKKLAAERNKYTKPSTSSSYQPISHYLLLPSYDWGIADWHLEVIQPYIKKHRPTVGFSPKEANLAKRVTVVGGEQIFPEEMLSYLRANGCQVERIDGTGTQIATLLAESQPYPNKRQA